MLYICREQKHKAMTIIEKELTEKIENLKGQLNYVNGVLESDHNFEAWELKEYKDLQFNYGKEIQELENHIEMCRTNNLI